MYLDIAKKDLFPRLKKVVSVVDKSTLPILENTLMKVEKGNLHLTATDAEVEVSTTFPIPEPNLDDNDDGSITIPARKLLDICNALPANAQLRLSTDDNERVIVKSGKSRFLLTTLPAEDFPETPLLDSVFSFDFQQGYLREILQNIEFSMADKDARYYLNGALMETDGKELNIVATDGHRLAVSSVTLDAEIETPLETPLQSIIPRKTVLQLIKLLMTDDKKVNISFDANHIIFTIDGKDDNLIVASKLIDGRFPDYKVIMPTLSDKTFIAKTELLKQALSRVSILSNEKFKGVRLSLSKDTLILNAKNALQEESEEVIEVHYQGEPLEIGFNASYLLDVANVVDTDSTELHFTDENSSCLMNPRDNDTLKYVIMPMRL